MRWIKAGVAACALTIVTGGAPVALLAWGSLPRRWSWASLLTPDDGALLFGLATVAGWLAWAVWAWALAAELVARSRHLPAPQIAGLNVLQSCVGALLTAALLVGPRAAMADTVPTAVAAVSTVADQRADVAIPAVDVAAVEHQTTPTYTVQPGDDLWSIAEKVYGDGLKWRQIITANPHISDPAHIEAGWVLAVPGANKSVHTAKPTQSQQPVVPRTPTTARSTSKTTPSSSATSVDQRQKATEHGKALVQQVTAIAESMGKPLVSSTAPLADVDEPNAMVGVLGLGATVAGLVLTAVAYRRRQRDYTRAPGRRFIAEPSAVERLQAMLSLVADPLGPADVEKVNRAIGARGSEPPALHNLVLGSDSIRLQLDSKIPPAPQGFWERPDGWEIPREGVVSLGDVTGSSVAYPGLVCVGQSPAGAHYVDLASLGLLSLEGDHADELRGGLMVAFAQREIPEIRLIVSARDAQLAEALDFAHTVVNDLDEALHAIPAVPSNVRSMRLDPDLAPENLPCVIFWPHQPTLASAAEIGDRGGILVAPGIPQAQWSLSDTTLVSPADSQPIEASRLTATHRAALVALVDSVTSPLTESAWWWADDVEGISYLTPRPTSPLLAGRSPKETLVSDPPVVHHPYLRLLGPIELLGAHGEPPVRATKQCMEYAAWLLENPGSTASHMATALFVAEGTRRSNMSRLRAWLGKNDDGLMFLPDAYSGRISLDATVSSDWNTFQLCIAPGVNRVGPDSLVSALELVRGCPLADAAPSQWYWAEELRGDMVGAIRDTALRLAEIALQAGDVDLVRWAVNRGLAAAPEDERLVIAKAKAEKRAGNTAEVERLVLRLTHHARTLGVDLADDTVMALQELLEHRVRARSIGDAGPALG